MNNLTIPQVGTLIAFVSADIAMSADFRTYMCRIMFDEQKQEWVIASRLNTANGRWYPVAGNKSRRIGLMVFLNDKPDSTDTHIRVSAVKPSGRAVWADPVKVSQ